MITHLVPTHDDSLTNQTQLTPVSDEEFDANLLPTKVTFKDRIIQLIFFFLFFGWLRLILLIIICIIYLIVMLPVILLCHKKSIVSHLTPPGIAFTRFFFRIAYFLLGIYRIKIKGEINHKARCFVMNHQSVLDGPMLFIFKPFIVIGMAELKSAPIAGQILESVNTLFVDRSHKGGQSHVIEKYLNEDHDEPMALFPEGKTTKGHFLLQFRTGAFLAKVPIQPVAIRYKEFLPFGQTGIIWVVGGLKEWLIRLICLPGCFAELNFLPVLDGEEFQEKTPQEKALQANLVIANTLGVQASDRSSRNMFKNNEIQIHAKNE